MRSCGKGTWPRHPYPTCPQKKTATAFTRFFCIIFTIYIYIYYIYIHWSTTGHTQNVTIKNHSKSTNHFSVSPGPALHMCLVKCRKESAFCHQVWPTQDDWHHNRVKKNQNLSGEEIRKRWLKMPLAIFLGG